MEVWVPDSAVPHTDPTLQVMSQLDPTGMADQYDWMGLVEQSSKLVSPSLLPEGFHKEVGHSWGLARLLWTEEHAQS